MGQELNFTKISSDLSGSRRLTLFELIYSTSPETNYRDSTTETLSDSFVLSGRAATDHDVNPHSPFVSSSREIDFVKKEEEMKKALEEKDAWYREQMESLQERVC